MNKFNCEVILLHLSLIDGIGPVAIKKILQYSREASFNLQDLYTLKQTDFSNLFGFAKNVAHKLYLGLKDISLLEREAGLIGKHNIRFVTVLSKEYPELLKHIHAPPPVLYIKSENNENILCHNKKIAFVGSRKAHRYGEQFIERVIPQVTKHNWLVVSGGAIGADSMAHRQTVESGGQTISVIGSGLLHPYPHSNKKLFEKIIESGGALVSPFKLETVARPGNFPARNRVIAGLSLGCVVVQAAKKSGASITAQFALDQGREVFAVPGPIDDELSLGCHTLIQQGAKLVSCAEDILCEFAGYLSPKVALNQKEQKNKNNTKTQDKNTKILEIAKSLQSKPKIIQTTSAQSVKYASNSIEHAILTCCAKQSCAIEEIAVVVNKSIHELHEILFDMQLSGDIKQNHAGMFERV
ncbi:DNA-processing protein DprA [Candidatus Dependentiae bacterium]